MDLDEINHFGGMLGLHSNLLNPFYFVYWSAETKSLSRYAANMLLGWVRGKDLYNY